ncbi:hypothetical protein Efla_001763 [Eimeria flavescens]
MSRSSGGCVAVEGCTVGFCASPGGAFDGQAMCLVLDMSKAGDVSGACDFCAIHLNTSTRHSLVPGSAPRTLMLAEDVPHLVPNSWMHIVVQYAIDLIRQAEPLHKNPVFCVTLSLWVGGECIGEEIKLGRSQLPFLPYDEIYTNKVGVAVYGKTRMLVKSFRISPSTAPQEKRGTLQPLLFESEFSKIQHLMTEGESGGCDGQEAELTRVVEREMLSPSTGISFKDIVALASAKDLLTEAVLLPLQVPELLTGLLEPAKGVLLFGPPGTGKTLLASAVASLAEVSFFRCSPATLTSKWRGDSEKLVRALFKTARARAPSVLFFDEADALCSQRGREDEHEASRRFKAELLQQIDVLWSGPRNCSHWPPLDKPGRPAAASAPTLTSRVVVVAATNAPWDLDEALRRRLEKRVDGSVDLELLARRTQGFSCSDIKSLCREAAMQPVRRLLKATPLEAIQRALLQPEARQPVTAADFEFALRNTRPSVSEEAALRHAKWNATFGSA